MFWLLSFPIIQLLVLIWILQLVYTAFATLKSNIDDRIKPLIIILLFVSCYQTISISRYWVGTPSFTDDEIIGNLNGFDQFTFEGKQKLAIMVTTKSGPFMFAIPYDSVTEKDLDQSMQRKSKTGQLTLIRKRSSNQLEIGKQKNGGQDRQGQQNGNQQANGGASGTGPLEYYDFTEQLLAPKQLPENK